jgi:DNA-binding GntR family transcriptional regulator
MHVYTALTARIDGKELPPGTRLNIGLIADEFGVSRDTVQRAIGMLADEGKIIRWPGLGWYVQSGPADH